MKDEPFTVTGLTSRATSPINHGTVRLPLPLPPRPSHRRRSQCPLRGVQSARGPPPAGARDGAGQAGLHHLLPGPQAPVLAPPVLHLQHDQQVREEEARIIKYYRENKKSGLS